MPYSILKMVVLYFFTPTPMMNMYVKKGKLRLYIHTKIGEIFMGHNKRRGYKSERLKSVE
jgi:hypothetical protein